MDPTSELPEKDELLGRFIDSRGKMSQGRASWRAFEPALATQETSVFNISSLPDAAVWQIAATELEPETGRLVIARAELFASEVAIDGLYLYHDDDPPRHRSIRGWPVKEQAKTIAMKLALSARTVLRPKTNDEGAFGMAG